jgi:gamma-glutamylcyclotransferase (GGCT)/AIG2-like uncharacterized protein YtfP
MSSLRSSKPVVRASGKSKLSSREPNPLLFVYGTLRRNRTNRFARKLRTESKIEFAKAELKADLLERAGIDKDVGSFPGIIRTGPRAKDKVIGQVLRLKDPTKTFETWLDAYEAADKEATPRLFRRKQVRILPIQASHSKKFRESSKVQPVEVWIYVLSQRKTGPLSAIASKRASKKH